MAAQDHNEPCKGLVEYKAKTEGDFNLIRSEMQHQVKIISDYGAEISECVNQITEGSKIFVGVDARLQAGNDRFDKIEDKNKLLTRGMIAISAFIVYVHGQTALDFIKGLI